MFRKLVFTASIALASQWESSVAADPYQPFTHGESGVKGFGVGHRGALCIVMPKIPGLDIKGGVFALKSGSSFELAKSTAIEQPGTTIHIFAGISDPHAFGYEPDFTLKAGQRLVAVGPDGSKVGGTLYYHPANGEDYSS